MKGETMEKITSKRMQIVEKIIRWMNLCVQELIDETAEAGRKE
jgi:hypothetical protein